LFEENEGGALNPVLQLCPVCGEMLTVTELHCRSCDTTIHGHFQFGRLAQLNADHLQFVETFLQSEGKIKAVEARLGISYPTVRARLRDVITAMGFTPEPDAPEEPDSASEADRRRILEDLASGNISSDEAIALLRGS